MPGPAGEQVRLELAARREGEREVENGGVATRPLDPEALCGEEQPDQRAVRTGHHDPGYAGMTIGPACAVLKNGIR